MANDVSETVKFYTCVKHHWTMFDKNVIYNFLSTISGIEKKKKKRKPNRFCSCIRALDSTVHSGYARVSEQKWYLACTVHTGNPLATELWQMRTNSWQFGAVCAANTFSRNAHFESNFVTVCNWNRIVLTGIFFRADYVLGSVAHRINPHRKFGGLLVHDT